VERISIYPFVDAVEPGGDGPLGLVRADGSTRPAFDAYRAASRHLRGARPGQVDRDPDLTLVTLDRDDDQVFVAWANGPRAATARIEAAGRQAVVVDRRGQASTLTAEDGAFPLTLAPAETSLGPSEPDRYVVGGPPLILVARSTG
jgi:hypothetical protein